MMDEQIINVGDQEADQKQGNMQQFNVEYQDNQIQQDQSPEPKQEDKKSYSCFSIEMYQQYFDVNTMEVADRMLQQFKVTTNFYETSRLNPDLYGPFWIYTTLIFVLAATGNVTKKEYDFDFVPFAALLIYGYGTIIPIILAFLMKYFGSSMNIIHMICIYGYSIFTYIPISILCMIPSSPFRWLLLFVALLNSTRFLIMNLWNQFGAFVDKQRYAVMGFIIGCQFIMFLIYRLYFFGEIYNE